jgi:hypothetical protein
LWYFCSEPAIILHAEARKQPCWVEPPPWDLKG